jgi:hypothetical protein
MKILLSLLFLISLCPASGQKEVLTLNLKKSGNQSIRGVTLNDSAFIVVSQSREVIQNNGPTQNKGAAQSKNTIQVTGTQCFWITATGNREVELPELKGLPVFAIGGTDSTYYYFLKEEKKGAFVGALAVKGNARKLSNQTIELATLLYGSYVENGHLLLLTAEKAGYSLLLLEYDGLNLVKKTRFPLSFELGKFKKSRVSFYNAAVPALPVDVVSPIKIVKDKACIWICIDDRTSRSPDDPNLQFKTNVTRFDLTTGQASNRIFTESSGYFFNSIVYKDHLYRVVQENGFRFEVFSLASGSKVFSHTRPVVQANKVPIVWINRNGKSLTVNKMNEKYFGLPPRLEAFVMVDSVDNGGVIVSLGLHNEISPRVPGVPSFGLMGVLVPLVATVAIRETGEGPHFYDYMHFLVKDWKQDFFNDRLLRRQRIDDFETSLRTLSFKGYVHTPGNSFGIYIDVNSNKLSVLCFD